MVAPRQRRGKEAIDYQKPAQSQENAAARLCFLSVSTSYLNSGCHLHRHSSAASWQAPPSSSRHKHAPPPSTRLAGWDIRCQVCCAGWACTRVVSLPSPGGARLCFRRTAVSTGRCARWAQDQLLGPRTHTTEMLHGVCLYPWCLPMPQRAAAGPSAMAYQGKG